MRPQGSGARAWVGLVSEEAGMSGAAPKASRPPPPWQGNPKSGDPKTTREGGSCPHPRSRLDPDRIPLELHDVFVPGGELLGRPLPRRILPDPVGHLHDIGVHLVSLYPDDLAVDVLGQRRGQPYGDRRDEARIHLVADSGEHGQIVCQPRLGDRRDRIDTHPVLLQFESAHAHETVDPRLRRAVVALTEVPHEACDRGCADDGAFPFLVGVPLLAHDLSRGLGHEEGSLHVNGHHDVEVCLIHLEERLVAKDPRVVHKDVDLPEGIRCRLHDVRRTLFRSDRIAVRNGLAPQRLDLGHNLVGH